MCVKKKHKLDIFLFLFILSPSNEYSFMHYFSSIWNMTSIHYPSYSFIKLVTRKNLIHPCEKVIGMLFQNQIWSRLLDIDRLCLVCIKRSIEEVKKCQISKHGYHQELSDVKLKKARCQFGDVKFGHRIMEAVGFFDYKMHSFIQITFNFTNEWSKGVVWWFTDMILHKWYFCKL